MTVKFETRGYDHTSTPEQVEALRERVYLHSPGVVMYREVPVPTLFQLDVFQGKLTELTRSMDSYALLVDLTEAAPPTAEIRAHLRIAFSARTNIRICAVFTGRNFMLNVAAKFVLSGIG